MVGPVVGPVVPGIILSLQCRAKQHNLVLVCGEWLIRRSDAGFFSVSLMLALSGTSALCQIAERFLDNSCLAAPPPPSCIPCQGPSTGWGGGGGNNMVQFR